jgi:hypothetical protein
MKSAKASGQSQVRLYQFFNLDFEPAGLSFSLCDTCVKTKLKTPKNLSLEKLAEVAVKPCNICGRRNPSDSDK